METIQQALLHTPLWVYILFAFLLYRGYRASKPSVMSVAKLFILPVIFLFLSGHTILILGTWTGGLITMAIIAFVIGAVAGWLLAKTNKLEIDHQKGLVKMQGSWFTMVLVLLIFGIKYYIGYQMGSNPNIINNMSFLHFGYISCGVLMGLIVGRLIHYVYCYKTYESVDLEEERK